MTGTTVAPERVHTDEISECSAECAAEAGVMFGGSNAVEVDFHIIVPEGLQDTTASLMETLKESETQLEVAVEGTVMAASMASLMPPVTTSAPPPPQPAPAGPTVSPIKQTVHRSVLACGACFLAFWL